MNIKFHQNYVHISNVHRDTNVKNATYVEIYALLEKMIFYLKQKIIHYSQLHFMLISTFLHESAHEN